MSFAFETLGTIERLALPDIDVGVPKRRRPLKSSSVERTPALSATITPIGMVSITAFVFFASRSILTQSFDGTKKTILNSAAPIRNETDEISGAVDVMQDITHQEDPEKIIRKGA
jgi:hypothetical protein